MFLDKEVDAGDIEARLAETERRARAPGAAMGLEDLEDALRAARSRVRMWGKDAGYYTGEMSLDPELPEVPGAVEDPAAQELSEVRIPLEEEVPYGVGVDARLGPHVTGLGEHPPEELADPAPDRVVHLILWNWFRRTCLFP